MLRLQFLENHFLLASINKFGQLRYQDVTMGSMVGNFRTGLGRTNVMQVNPFNGVVSLGHSGGTVTMWKPTSASPLVKMLCHHGPVSALAFHSNGLLMATAGKDKKIKLWHLEANFLRVSPWQLTLFFSLDCIHKLDKFRLHHKEFLLVTHHKEIVFTSNKFVHFLCKIQRKKKKTNKKCLIRKKM